MLTSCRSLKLSARWRSLGSTVSVMSSWNSSSQVCLAAKMALAVTAMMPAMPAARGQALRAQGSMQRRSPVAITASGSLTNRLSSSVLSSACCWGGYLA